MSQEWAKLKEKMKAKRAKPKQPTLATGVDHILQEESLVVQRLSAGVSGKAQKYTRVGAREFVLFSYTDVTILNIIEACDRHFADTVGIGHTCDVLAGEQGPSCHSLGQLPDLKVIHVRFVENDINSISLISKPTSPKSMRKGAFKMSVSSDGVNRRTGINNSIISDTAKISKFIPKSLSAVQMMKLGKVINDSIKRIEVTEFLIDGMCWSTPTVVDFQVENESFGKGGFRSAYKAICNSKHFSDKTWVLKKYLPKTIKEFEDINQTVEQHTRKQVQMHCLARNIAGKLNCDIEKINRKVDFGETFQYNKIVLGKLGENEFVTLEEFIEGNFSKYINNDGAVCDDNDQDVIDKAECLVHYSYLKSDKELAIVDIQGCGYYLCDPEIASRTAFLKDELLFTTGNLSTSAINNFLDAHMCKEFCKILDLDKE